ncbi:dihydropteroate synthase [Salinisphaera sp. PC39]|uniref:dihydropteroate synthase n=1 Tax=Salinisphaera sp. PC39 TaxID=1304156 RepID=UPI0033429A18
MKLICRDRTLDLGRPAVMGVLNVTPDSFSDGGEHDDIDRAVRRALSMVEEGADIVDIGGESTRPGAEPVDEALELERVLPVIEALRPRTGAVISIDTVKPGVMRAACAAGADLINDVRGLREPGALAAAAETGAGVCLMHMQGRPRTMQSSPNYSDVVLDVRDFLTERIETCVRAGIPRERLVVDPGFGFGKNLAHNLALLRRLPELVELGPPLLVGVSRKSMFAHLLGDIPAKERLPASLAAAAIAVTRGARLVRVHDVAATRQAVDIAWEVRDP